MKSLEMRRSSGLVRRAVTWQTCNYDVQAVMASHGSHLSMKVDDPSVGSLCVFVYAIPEHVGPCRLGWEGVELVVALQTGEAHHNNIERARSQRQGDPGSESIEVHSGGVTNGEIERVRHALILQKHVYKVVPWNCCRRPLRDVEATMTELVGLSGTATIFLIQEATAWMRQNIKTHTWYDSDRGQMVRFLYSDADKHDQGPFCFGCWRALYCVLIKRCDLC